MKSTLDILLFIMLSVFSYFLVNKVRVSLKSNKYRKRCNNDVITKAYSLETLFSNFNFINAKENFLSKQGFPLNLHAVSYYMTKVCLTFVLFCAAIVNFNSKYIAIIYALVGYYFLDFYIFINKKNRDSEICIDLLNVVNSISLQLSADVSLKDSIKRQFENCRNKDFRKAILEFSMKYELSELNLDSALKELEEKFDILEVRMFCKSLREYNEFSDINEILENLSETLKVKYMAKIQENTRTKVLYITFGVIVALGNIIMLTFYPLFISIGEGFNSIFS